ncbi:YdcF family protein [Varunaivibrio sulfuroxidans]|uniref:Uncharacterized SAM-binding protein YcdF (DUF218 family) n=1 Tax=Varunaivibrio sulfuroxidans TaxID=1773489 RepID=A0A4R3JGE8_9PROT|nr:YdcF family protein [Varunaivibrio sulfuroxidans]TCS64373.1 uncharacterized SAM-binding protein YcdF (DUF218 family) [Varunaivibrio sulfuroxidans]WES31195.1 YdcF family protein [Varunaivibrio sulfuroxidans]
MFFYLSKIFWFFVSPGNLILFTIAIGVLLLWMGYRSIGRGIATIGVLLFFVFGMLPVGSWALGVLEETVLPPKTLPAHVDGIITLGGGIDPFITAERDQVTLTESAERLTEFMRLGRLYPHAQLIFTGGSNDPLRQKFSEAEAARRFMREQGFDVSRVMFETRARNTAENVRYSYELATPNRSETWILITSAYHMPRALGVFREKGWRVIPYPVDYRTDPQASPFAQFNVTHNLRLTALAWHEWLGLLIYRLTGRAAPVSEF